MNALLSKNTQNYLPLIEQANRRQLPDSLSIAQIVELQYPKTRSECNSLQERLTLSAEKKGAEEALTDACNDKLLRFSLVKKQNLYIPDGPTTYYDQHIIHKDDLRAYLLDQEGKPWPVIVASLKGLLANWWPDDEQKAETVANDDESLAKNGEPSGTNTVQSGRKRGKKDTQRDGYFREWLLVATDEEKVSWATIEKALVAKYGRIFSKGFLRWAMNQQVYKVRDSGSDCG